jgi:hypothetical protein
VVVVTAATVVVVLTVVMVVVVVVVVVVKAEVNICLCVPQMNIWELAVYLYSFLNSLLDSD